MQKHRGCCGFSLAVAIGLALFANAMGQAQEAPPAAMSIEQAVERALKNYPAVSVSQDQVNAAAVGIELARTAYLPRIDSLAQINEQHCPDRETIERSADSRTSPTARALAQMVRWRTFTLLSEEGNVA
jgi:outer membrane protein TolC